MLEPIVLLPKKPRITKSSDTKHVFEIDGLYPGYGHTLGNAIRRIILSSVPGVAITTVKIKGADHEFATLEGVKEDVITVLLNLKKIRFNVAGTESYTGEISVKGPGIVTAQEISVPSQVVVVNPDQYICEITTKAEFSVSFTIEHGLGFVPKENLRKEKVEVGTITLDASFTPIRRVHYEVEDMRVGDKTDYNRLTLTIETDGTVDPLFVFESSIKTLLLQLQSLVSDSVKIVDAETNEESPEQIPEIDHKAHEELVADIMKIRIDNLDFSTRTLNSLQNANIRTIGGIARKKEEDLLDIDGIGDKGLQEIRKVLAGYGIELK